MVGTTDHGVGKPRKNCKIEIDLPLLLLIHMQFTTGCIVWGPGIIRSDPNKERGLWKN